MSGGSPVPTDPVSAVALGIGEIFGFGSAIVESEAAAADRAYQAQMASFAAKEQRKAEKRARKAAKQERRALKKLSREQSAQTERLIKILLPVGAGIALLYFFTK